MTKQITCELVDVMGNDLSIVNAARVSFNKEKDVMDSSDEKLIKYLASHRHMTPFRHNAIELRCKAPIFLARQLGKHQAGLSWNEVSRRYVDTPPEFYIPEEWRAKPEGSIKQGSSEVDLSNTKIPLIFTEDDSVQGFTEGSMKEAYDEFVDVAEGVYEALLSKGVAPEMARMVLPQSMLTEWIWTGNLLAFAHVYKERIAEGAQEEAKMFARELDELLRPLFPEAWGALVDD